MFEIQVALGFIAVMAFSLAFVLWISGHTGGTSTQWNSLVQLMRKYDGVVEKVAPPRVRFRYRDANVEVRLVSDPISFATRAEIRYWGKLPEISFVVHRKNGSHDSRTLEPNVVKIGSPHFDKYYVIRGNKAERLRQVLHVGVQDSVRQTCHAFADAVISVAHDDGLLVKASLHTVSFSKLDRLVSLSMILYEQLAYGDSEGIEIMASHATEGPTASANCQVCGEPLTRDIVYCSSCKTPHHKECWNYIGRCSTYACNETDFEA
jgi:hypothetical protein